MCATISDWPFVSVIVPVFNHTDALFECVQALAKQTYDATRYEIIVVENGPLRTLDDLLHTFPMVRLLHQPKPGSYAARNVGIAEAKGSVFAWTDADCRPHQDWLERGVMRLAALEDGGMVAGHIEIVTRADANAIERYVRRFHLQQKLYVNDCHFGATANVLCTRKTFEIVGVFNEEHFSGGDAEWGMAVYKAGLPQVFADDAIVDHIARRTWGTLINRLRRITGGRYGRRNMFPMEYRSPLHPQELRAFVKNIYFLWHDMPDDSRRKKISFLFFFSFERLVMIVEWIRLDAGGKPVR